MDAFAFSLLLYIVLVKYNEDLLSQKQKKGEVFYKPFQVTVYTDTIPKLDKWWFLKGYLYLGI